MIKNAVLDESLLRILAQDQIPKHGIIAVLLDDGGALLLPPNG